MAKKWHTVALVALLLVLMVAAALLPESGPLAALIREVARALAGLLVL